MASRHPSDPTKPGAKLDPKGTALVKKMRDLSKQAQAELGKHVGSIRVMPKNRPPGDHCSCACACSH